ncbi:MAG: DUF3842 family protein, partial [Pygmaiobacter sp.]
MKIVVIDGQGGSLGKALIERLKKELPEHTLLAIGTNSIATSAMLRAGADQVATGENPVLVACRSADIITGPLGILAADSLLGEITPAMALAVGQSSAVKVLLPVSRCHVVIAGAQNLSLNDCLLRAVEEIKTLVTAAS